MICHIPYFDTSMLSKWAPAPQKVVFGATLKVKNNFNILLKMGVKVGTEFLFCLLGTHTTQMV